VAFISLSRDIVADGQVTLPAKLSATLVDGAIPDDFTLPTVADAAREIDGVYYKVVEDFPGGRGGSTGFIIFVASDATSVDMATVAPVVPVEQLDSTRGPAGVGVPAGGTSGQVMVKASDADYDMEWGNPGDASVTNPAVNAAIEAAPAATRTALGLGTAATTDAAAYATAIQGGKADSAVQPGDLGTAAIAASTDFATAAQGEKADTAIQPADLSSVATSGAYSDLTGTPSLGTAAVADTGDFDAAGAAAAAQAAAEAASAPIAHVGSGGTAHAAAIASGAAGFMSGADKTKLDGIALGATANTGDVVGPASTTDARIATFDGTTGKLLQDGGKTIADVMKQAIGVACSDETTDLTTGAAKVTFRMPYAFTVSEVRASLTGAPSGSALTVDINEAGASILSTKLTIDAGEKTSTTAATPAVISDASLADDAEITVDIDGVGSTIAGKGLKVWLIGTRA
jgi:hypothetical protein